MNRFQRIAVTAFVCLEVLIFIGAMVRATGSGLGCPDWPFCYGCVVPPTSADQIDFTKLNLDKFKKKAEQHGRDPNTITVESLRAEFNPVATWVEYGNRLSSIPVSLSVLALLIASFGQLKLGRPGVVGASVAAFILLIVNAWLGARVVLSGLQPGTITIHMALAVVMVCVVVYAAWRGTHKPWTFDIKSSSNAAAAGSATIRLWALILFALIVIEGIMGSQVREMTDSLAKTHFGQPRLAWSRELEQTWVYLVHRSFSWLILLLGGFLVMKSRPADLTATKLQKIIFGLIIGQMCLGIVLSQVGIVAIAQICHIGLSSLLVSALFLWLLAARTGNTVSTSVEAEPLSR